MEYVRLGDSGLKISKIILGCMSYGNPGWGNSPWILGEEKALPLLKKAYDVGINTWVPFHPHFKFCSPCLQEYEDTADTYSNGESERLVGKALKKYGIPRSKVVILTKICQPVLEDDPTSRIDDAKNQGHLVNQMGLSRKHIFDAVEGCLRRLDTDYIDVLQIHRLDHETTPEEIMRALHDVVQSGKVRYLGASSMYTWEFARLQYIARLNHWTPFIAMQGFYNLLYREEEREMIPFCRATGVGLIPWSPLARGILTRPVGEQSARSLADKKSEKWFAEAEMEIVSRVEEVASKRGADMALVATAWVLTKEAYPIVGLASEERIDHVIQALKLKLTDEEIVTLEELYRPLRVVAM